jgi:hypothetical protein
MERLAHRKIINMIYTLLEKTSFTLDTEDWRMVLMEKGDKVKIEENEIYISTLGEEWHKTIDTITEYLMKRLG